MNSNKILIVEDDAAIAEGLADFLEPKGYQLDFAYRGNHALELLGQYQYQLVLLDVNLPKVNGLAICEKLSSGSKLTPTPVLIMTANKSLDQKLEGFDAGAWDYLIKPFSFRELDARIKVLLTRSTPLAQKPLAYADLSLNPGRTAVTTKQHKIKLSATGLQILTLLMESAPDPVSHKTLCEALWGGDMPDSDPLRAHIYQLRQSLKKANSQVSIKSMKNVGYCLQQPVARP